MTTTTQELVKSVDATTAGTYFADSDADNYAGADLMLADKMTTLVKGAGYARPGGNTPLNDDDAVFKKAMQAETAFRRSIKQGIQNPSKVVKSLNPEFGQQFGRFMAASPQNQMMSNWVGNLQEQISQVLGKSITLTSPLSTGFVPFNLVAPSRLIYPVYSPLRNKLPRTPGQGTSYRAKIVTGISGSQTGASGGAFVDIAIPELVQGSGNLSNWPLNLPASGNQDSVDINVPYRFFGLSENLSWLAQFAGQGQLN